MLTKIWPTNGKISNISQTVINYFLNINHGGLTVYMSNTAGVLWEALTAYPSRAPEFNPVYLVGSVLLIFLVFCVVLLCVFTLRVPSCDFHYDFRIKTKFGFVFTCSCLWDGACLVWVICVCLCVVVSLKYSITFIYYTYQHYCNNDSNEC